MPAPTPNPPSPPQLGPSPSHQSKSHFLAPVLASGDTNSLELTAGKALLKERVAPSPHLAGTLSTAGDYWVFAEAPNLEVTNAAGTCHSLCFLLLLLPKLLLPLHQGSDSDTPGDGYPAQQPHLGTLLRVWKGGTIPPERHYCKSLLVSAAFRRGTRHFLGCAAAPAEPLLRPAVPQLTGAHGPSGDVPRPAGPAAPRYRCCH